MTRRLKIHVEENFPMDELRVFIMEPPGENLEVMRIHRYSEGVSDDDDTSLVEPRWKIEEVPAGLHHSQIEPSIVLPRAIAELLAPELLEYASPEVAQTKHLHDAIGVRDRLLAMIERGGVIPPP